MGTADQKVPILWMTVPFDVDPWDVSKIFSVTFGF